MNYKIDEKEKIKRIKKILNNQVIPDIKRSMKEIVENIDDYPDDKYAKLCPNKHKITGLKVNDDGSFEMDGIVLDGKENDKDRMTTYHICKMGDEEEADSEWRQFQDGTLKEVNTDNTKHIHQNNNRWNKLQDKISKKELKEV